MNNPKTPLKSIDLVTAVLVKTFGLNRIFGDYEPLDSVLKPLGEMSDIDTLFLNEARENLIQNSEEWNEEELKMQFISMIMFLSRIAMPIRAYYDREMSATIDGNFIKCKADMILSKGFGDMMETPYFFMHEYKREKKYSGDPIGQMLAAMLIGQKKNDNNKPIYGCYVQGRFWFFSVLIGKKYCISNSFDATNEQVAKEIVGIIRNIQHIIITKLLD